MTLLKTNTVDAHRAGQLVHVAGSLMPESVLRWVGQTVDALEELSEDQAETVASVHKTNFIEQQARR